MPAQGKKIIAQADSRLPQHVTPDGGDALFKFSLGLNMLSHVPHRFGQRAAIQLAAWAQRHGIKAQ